MSQKSAPASDACAMPARTAALYVKLLVLVWVSAISTLTAQDRNAPATPKGGLQIRSVSAYAAYYSSFVPNASAGIPSNSTKLPADLGAGGSIAFDWTKFTERTSFSLNYTPSYTGYVRNSSLNALNHALSLTTSQKFAHRWTFGFSAAGNLSSLEQSLFSPTTLSNVASTPATFDDLAAAILSSRFTNNPQLGAVLTGAPLVESPVRNLLYGQRMFTSSTHISLSYSYSPRLSVTFSGGAGRAQHLSDDIPGSGGYLIPNTTSGDAGVAISYSVSPRTQLGASAATTRYVSTLQDSYTTTSLVSLGRTLGRHWITQVHGGVGFTKPVGQTSFAIATTPRPAGGGSLGYKTVSHTLLGSFDRAVSDSYGVGATSTTSASASWRWHGHTRSWWLESSAGWQRLEGNSLTNTSGWHGSAGCGRAVSSHVVLHVEYSYLSYSGLQASASGLSQSAVRLSMAWEPQRR